MASDEYDTKEAAQAAAEAQAELFASIHDNMETYEYDPDTCERVQKS
jgi:hypothetical protein